MARSQTRHALPAIVPLTAALLVGLLGACSSPGAGPTAAAPGSTSPAAAGMQLAAGKGCLACHSTDGTRKAGPTWLGLAGSTVTVADGRTVTADTDYLRRSIQTPQEEIVAGFAPSMPTFTLTTDEVDQLVAAIEQLGAAPRPG